MRRSRNIIFQLIKETGEVIEDEEEIKGEVLGYFRDLFVLFN